MSDPLDLAEIKADLRLVYMTLRNRSGINRNDGSDEDSKESNDEESTFVAGAKFKKRCHKCGRFGQKSADCPNSGNGTQKSKNGKKFNRKCYYCGKWGHRISECRKLQNDRKGNKKANVAHQDYEEGEVAFAALAEKKVKKSCFYWLGCGHSKTKCNKAFKKMLR